MADTPVFLTPEELAARWKDRIALGTLANWRSKGVGPGFTKLRGRVLYPLDKVQAYENACATETTP